IHPDQMPAVARLDRPAPRTGGELKQRCGEGFAKSAGDLLDRPIAVVVLEHEGIGERRSGRGVRGPARGLLERMQGVLARAITPPVGGEVELTKRGARWQREAW